MGSYYWIWYAPRVYDAIFGRAAKHIGFTADESASQCVDSTTEPVSRLRIGFTSVGYTCISTIASKSKQRVGPMADTSIAESGNDDTAQVSYESLGK